MTSRSKTGDVTAWRRLLRALTSRREPHVRVGVLASSGGASAGEGVTILEIAVIHEFGAPRAGIPQRSFIRGTVELKNTEINRLIGKLTRRMVRSEGRETPADMLEILGAWVASEIKKRIRDGIPPALKPETVEAKGSSTPLIDTGRLLNSITWEVVS